MARRTRPPTYGPSAVGTDANARDEVTETAAPIVLVVYANGAAADRPRLLAEPLIDGTGTTVKLQRHRETADGSAVRPRRSLELELRRRRHLGRAPAPTSPVRRAAPTVVTSRSPMSAPAPGAPPPSRSRTPAIARRRSQDADRRNGVPTSPRSPSGTDNGKHSDRARTGKTRRQAFGKPDTGAVGLNPGSRRTRQQPAAAPPRRTLHRRARSAPPLPAGPPSRPAAAARRRRHAAHRHRAPTHTRADPSGGAGRPARDRAPDQRRDAAAGRAPARWSAPTPAAAAAPPAARQATARRRSPCSPAALAVVVLLGLGAGASCAAAAGGGRRVAPAD